MRVPRRSPMWERNARQEHPVGVKMCNRCEQVLDVSEFDSVRRVARGRAYVSLYYVCRACKRQLNREARA